MSWESKPVINFSSLSVNAAAEASTVPELISLLRVNFRQSEFDRVEHLLMGREENLKRTLREREAETEVWKKKYELLEKKQGEAELGNLRVKKELEKYKQNCDELREEVTRRQREYCDQVKSATDTSVNLLERFTNAENDKKGMIGEIKSLNGEITRLSCEKSRVETVLEAWKNKFGELEFQVSQLDEDEKKLLRLDPSLKKKIEVELGIEMLVSDQVTVKEENSDKENPNSRIDVEIVHCGKDKFLGSQSKSLGSTRNQRIHSSPTAGSTSSLPGSGLYISQTADRQYFGKACGDVIVIDSDHEEHIENVTTPVSGFCAPIPKRKRAPSCSDNDDNNLTEKRKTIHLQEKSHACKNTPDNPDQSATDVVQAFHPSSLNLGFIRRCDEKHEKKSNKHPSSGIGNDDSSDSADDIDGVSYMDNAVAELRRRRESAVWAYEADICAELERSSELCMNAVCAFYRQQMLKEKSRKESKWGFSEYDLLRGMTLTKRLIDGDPEGKLRKSVSELQQLDPSALSDCKTLAKRYSSQLFEIYQKEKDPFFRPLSKEPKTT